MNPEILDDSFDNTQSFSVTNPILNLSLQLGIGLLSLILFFIGYSIYLSAELGIGLIVLTQFMLNFRTATFKDKKPINFLRLLGANLLLLGVFLQVYPYPNATNLQSLGLIILILYYFIWAFWYDNKSYYSFLFLKLQQSISIASFCWAIRVYTFSGYSDWFLFGFLFSTLSLITVAIIYIIDKKIPTTLFIHLPLVIWTILIHLTVICIKLF